VARLNLEERLTGSPILGYGFSVVAVAVALGLSLISLSRRVFSATWRSCSTIRSYIDGPARTPPAHCFAPCQARVTTAIATQVMALRCQSLRDEHGERECATR